MKPHHHFLAHSSSTQNAAVVQNLHSPLSQSFIPTYFNFTHKLTNLPTTEFPRDYTTLILKALAQYDLLQTESSLSILEDATNRYPNIFLAHLLYAEILSSTHSGKYKHYTSIQKQQICLKTLQKAKICIENKIKSIQQQQLNNSTSSTTNNTSNNNNNNQTLQTNDIKNNNQKILRNQMIEYWINSIECYVTLRFDQMYLSALEGIKIGDLLDQQQRISVPLPNSSNSPRSPRTNNNNSNSPPSNNSNHYSSSPNSNNNHSNNSMNNIFQHNFTQDIQSIQTFKNDFILAELWKCLFVAASHSNKNLNVPFHSKHSDVLTSSTTNTSSTHIRQLYRYLCKSLAYGCLTPSRVLCWLSSVCSSFPSNSIPNNSSSLLLGFNSSNQNDDYQDDDNYSGIVSTGTITSSSLSSKRGGDLFSLSFSPSLSSSDSSSNSNNPHYRSQSSSALPSPTKQKRSNNTNSRNSQQQHLITLSEMYYRDSFLINNRGSLVGSLQCIKSLYNPVEKILELMRVYPLEAKFNAELWALLGYIYYKEGEDKKSEQSYLRAIELEPLNFKVYESMINKFWLLCYRFFLFSEQKFISQVEKLFLQVEQFAYENVTNDDILYMLRGQQRCLLKLTHSYFDPTIDHSSGSLEQLEDEVERVIISQQFYDYFDISEKRFGMICKYTKMMRDKLYSLLLQKINEEDTVYHPILMDIQIKLQ
ncbi:hypothetical protein ABK040_008583 [Willaertia magna]